jgi:hypothetical protein
MKVEEKDKNIQQNANIHVKTKAIQINLNSQQPTLI